MSDTIRPLGGSPGAVPDSPFTERRQSIRFPLRDARGSLNWPDEAGEIVCEVSVLNISGGGAAVLAERAPQVGQALRLVLHSQSAMIEAVVVGISVDPSGKPVVRLRFVNWMPLDAILEKHRERRLWERYPARESRATVTWLDGTAEITTHGEVLNISGGGVAFAADILPPPGVPIWLQLIARARQVERADPVESRLVATSNDPSGMKLAHIQFVEPCPMDLFEMAIHRAA